MRGTRSFLLGYTMLRLQIAAVSGHDDQVKRLQHAVENHSLRRFVTDLERSAPAAQHRDQAELVEVLHGIAVPAKVSAAVFVPAVHHDVARRQFYRSQEYVSLVHGPPKKGHAVDAGRARVKLGKRPWVSVGQNTILQGRMLHEQGVVGFGSEVSAVRYVVATYELGLTHDDFVFAVPHRDFPQRLHQSILTHFVQESQTYWTIVGRDMPDVITADLVFSKTLRKKVKASAQRLVGGSSVGSAAK